MILAWLRSQMESPGPGVYVLVPGPETWRGYLRLGVVAETGRALPPRFLASEQLVPLRSQAVADGLECHQERILVGTLQASAAAAGYPLPEITLTTSMPEWGAEAFRRRYAAEAGRRGGQARTAAKASAARVNGLKGGRPKKKDG